MTLASPLALVTAVVNASVGKPLPFVGIEKVTVSPTTGLPLISVTRANIVELTPGLTAFGAALTLTAFGDPAVKLTLVVSANPLIVASTRALSTWAPAVKVTEAMPLESVVALAALRLPAVVTKLTKAPGTTSPALSLTSARTIVVPVDTGMLPLVAVVSTEPMTMFPELTPIVTAAENPLLVRAVMLSLPAFAPAV